MSILIAVWQLGPDFLINRLDWFNALRWHVTPNESEWATNVSRFQSGSLR